MRYTLLCVTVTDICDVGFSATKNILQNHKSTFPDQNSAAVSLSIIINSKLHQLNRQLCSAK